MTPRQRRIVERVVNRKRRKRRGQLQNGLDCDDIVSVHVRLGGCLTGYQEVEEHRREAMADRTSLHRRRRQHRARKR